MPEPKRQEVLNVLLAELLQNRGVVASPENILKSGSGKIRHMPDVLVIYQGVRTAIEGEIDSSVAREKALESARRRVDSGIAHIGIAVVYPEALRDTEFVVLHDALAHAELTIAIISEAGTSGYVQGNVESLERALRSTFEQLLKEDVVAEAVALIDAAVDWFASVVTEYPGLWGRITTLLSDSDLDDEELKQLSKLQIAANCRIAGLILLNALIFQGMLSKQHTQITSLQTLTEKKNPEDSFLNDWEFILENINFYSIFHIARQLFVTMGHAPGLPLAMHNMAHVAEVISRNEAALRHDLMGRVYHRLLADAKYLGTYYTSIPAAALLLKLALTSRRFDLAWENPEQVSQLRIADLACGTGTLLTAAADAVLDRYISASAAQSKPVHLDDMHKQLAESILYGYDVLTSAIHLTASTLAMRTPATPVKRMNLFSLPLGGNFHRLGSIEFLRNREVQMPLGDLFGALPKTKQVAGKQIERHINAPMPELDLCVMNPPFVRSVGGNLLFGSLQPREREAMQRALKKMVDDLKISASITAGLGSVFVAIGDRYLKNGGCLALVLPKALLSGVAWGKTRDLLNRKYRLDYIVVSHDAERWNFSESTDLSEVLLVATKNENLNTQEHDAHRVNIINLWRNPQISLEALAIAYAVEKNSAPDLADGQGALTLQQNGDKVGEMISCPWGAMRDDWFLPCAFAQSDLTRAAYHLLNGNLWLPGFGKQGQTKFCKLGDLGKLGPDRRDIHDGFDVSDAPTAFPTLWGHDAQAVLTLAQKANKYLAPLAKAKTKRSLRKVEDLWPLSGKLLIAERMWLKTQRIVAVRLPEAVLSNVWWSFAFNAQVSRQDSGKALVLWMNSTLGLLIFFATRDETRGAWVDFKKPSLGAMPVLDVRALTDDQLQQLADAYDRVCDKPLQPFPQMADDDVRAEIDRAIAQALNLPDFSKLRQMLGREPVVCMKRL